MDLLKKKKLNTYKFFVVLIENILIGLYCSFVCLFSLFQ